MKDSFYRDFEDQFRGSRELITSRLLQYEPLIMPFLELEKKPIALDLGCGRGEWLQITDSHGFHSVGVDKNASMFERASSSVELVSEDVLTYLKKLNAESISVITAFHIVEHLKFDEILELVEESSRVLKPGGVLIIETPNLENLDVATQTFYLDPTHLRPLPQLLMKFLSEKIGFKRNYLIRLNPEKEPVKTSNLYSLISMVGRDYSLLCQKNANDDVLNLFDEAFSISPGLSLCQAIENYDDFIGQQFKEFGEFKNLVNSISNSHLNQISSLDTRLKEIERSFFYRFECFLVKLIRNFWSSIKKG